jgi:hypothetical protein
MNTTISPDSKVALCRAVPLLLQVASELPWQLMVLQVLPVLAYV